MEIRLWKSYVNPTVARNIYSQTTREASNFYWKLYPIYEDQTLYEWNSGVSFQITGTYAINARDIVICEGNTYYDKTAGVCLQSSKGVLAIS